MDVNNDDDHFVAYLRNCFRLSQYWRLLISEALPSASSSVINTYFLKIAVHAACIFESERFIFRMVAPSLVDSISVESSAPLLKGGAVRYFKSFARSMMSFPEIKPQSYISKLPISQSNVDINFNTRLCTQVSVFSLSKLVDWKSGHDGDLEQTPRAD